MTIDTVVFDLDDTLVELALSTPELLDLTYERLGIETPFPPRAYYARRDELAGECDGKRALRRRCFVAAAREHGYGERLGREIAETYSRLRETEGIRLRPDAEAALDSLAAHYDLAVLTNGPPAEQRAKVEAVGLEKWVETIVCAGYDAPAKPDPAAFERVLTTLGTSADSTVAVGDSLAVDVAGAAAAGLETVWLVDEGPGAPSADTRLGSASAESDSGSLDVAPDHTIDSLAELRSPPWCSD